MTPSRIVAKKGLSTPLMTTASVPSGVARRPPWPPSAHPVALSRRSHAATRARRARRVVIDRRRPWGTTATLDVLDPPAAATPREVVLSAALRGRGAAERLWLSRHEPNHPWGPQLGRRAQRAGDEGSNPGSPRTGPGGGRRLRGRPGRRAPPGAVPLRPAGEHHRGERRAPRRHVGATDWRPSGGHLHQPDAARPAARHGRLRLAGSRRRRRPRRVAGGRHRQPPRLAPEPSRRLPPPGGPP